MKNLRYMICLILTTAATLCLRGVAFSAASEQVLYTFTGVPNGIYPLTKLVYTSGKIYGATSGGGAGECKCGTVFEMTPDTGGGWTYRTIYSFAGSPDGEVPVGNIIFDSAGNLYGVTGSGGKHGFGAVYELSPGSGGAWIEKVIYSFKASPDGNAPDAGLIFDDAGHLYGTTSSGGDNFNGTVFKLNLEPDGNWRETTLYRFGESGETDGSSPRAELILDKARNLYGTTWSGGTDSDGTVFELSPVSGGGWSESVLYSFTGGQDQGLTDAPVWMDSSGNLYGTTVGAIHNVQFGTVFELSPASSGPWTETTLHTFGLNQKDGSLPAGGLTVDAKGNLYGTTSAGGIAFAGTIYELEPGPDGTWNYLLYYTFTGGSDGGVPSTPVTFGANGVFFGPTNGGPTNGSISPGVIYEINP
jgi:uncharacterized repeat protein (TIGR03803 family)